MQKTVDPESLLNYGSARRYITIYLSSYIFDVRQANSPGCSPHHQYMSDNGETAAGNRLALLVSLTYQSWCHADCLQQLTGQYFGGIHLGADRFKHINQAARLNLVGFFPY